MTGSTPTRTDSVVGRRRAGYGLALVGTGAAIAVPVALGASINGQAAMVVLVLPIILAAYVGGLGPGLTATAIAAAAGDWLLLQPRHSFGMVHAVDVAGLVGLLVAGALVSALTEALHRSRRRAEFREHQAVLDAAEHRRLEQSARDHELGLARLIETAMDGIITLDGDGRVASFNPAAEAMFGCPAADAIGQPLDRFIPPRFRSQHSARVRSFAETGTTQRSPHQLGTVRGLRASGEEFPLEVSLSRTEVGGRRVATAILRDITERQRAEDALRLSEERFAKAFRASPVPIAVTRLSDGRFVEVNDSFVEFYGHTREQLAGHTVLELGFYVEPSLRDTLVATLRAHGAVRDFEVVLKTRAGELRETLLSAETLELAGEPHLITILVDVTARLRAEADARRTSEMMRQLAENIREVFWLTDAAKHEALYVSPAYDATFGRSSALLRDDPDDWLTAVHPDDRERVRDAVHTKQRSGLFDETYRVVWPDGAVRWIHDRAFPIRDAAGRVVRIAGVAEDVTERLRLEEQVRHTQKMESIGLLAGGVAHDFNNMATVILACTELLRVELGAGRGSAGELVAEIQQAVARATSLTRQLLVFSRKEVSEPKVVDLNDAVVDTEKMLRRLLGEDVVLETALDHAISRVRIDPGHLVQVLMNLAVNARDAMPRGGRLTIATREVDLDGTARAGLAPGRYVRLEMTDTGCGMTAEVRSRVFEPFFTTKETGRGTGMGLAVAHGIVEQCRGHIAVDSEPGVGTTFEIFLPAIDAAATTTGDAAAVPDARGDETILLVEDEEGLRKIEARALEAHGYTVLQASGGALGLELLRANAGRIHLLVTDVVMPGMDGRELAHAAGAVAPEVKVLYTSGYTDDAVIRHGVRQAEVDFLQKPFTSAALLRKVREVLDAPARATSPPPASATVAG